MYQRIRDLTGQVFGRLTVIRLDGRIRRSAAWHCRCECGTEKRINSSSLTSGKTVSCGCRMRAAGAERTRTHGETGKTPENVAWNAMRGRCLNQRNRVFKHYGGRGIRICAGWNTYEVFLADMGRKPTPTHSIDRIDNDAGYDCGKCTDCFSRGVKRTNCRWATKKEQARNRRTNRLLTFQGLTRTIVAWSEVIGISQEVLEARLALGWSTERTLSEAFEARTMRIRGESHRLAKLTEDDVRAIRKSTDTHSALGVHYGVSGAKIWQIRNGIAWKHVS